MKEQTSSAWISTAKRVPPRGHSVHYRTATHLGLGYFDTTGRWLSFEGRVEPERVIAWAEPNRGTR